MQITTGLGWETGHNLAFLRIGKTEGKGRGGLVRTSLVRLGLCIDDR